MSKGFEDTSYNYHSRFNLLCLPLKSLREAQSEVRPQMRPLEAVVDNTITLTPARREQTDASKAFLLPIVAFTSVIVFLIYICK